MHAHYYLHSTSKDLIHKKLPIDPSDFTQKIWVIDTTNRADAWKILLEALALGAKVERIKELAKFWECDGRDLVEFMTRNLNATETQRKGLRLFISKVMGIEPETWFDWLAKTPKGEHPNFDEMPSCLRCRGIGAVDAPFSGSDPCCPDCDGTGRALLGETE